MCAVSEGWVAPDFGVTLSRTRIVQTILDYGDRPCIIFGSSGSGKSVAAAQYALNAEGQVVWVDAGGECIAPKRIAKIVLEAVDHSEGSTPNNSVSEDESLADLLDAIVRTLRCASHSGGLCVVIDDFGEIVDPAVAVEVRALGKALWRSGSRLIVTTRRLDNWPASVLRVCGLVGQLELALTTPEARELLFALGMGDLANDVEVLHEACGGHLAFFTILSRQALAHGMVRTVARTPSLNAWLEFVIGEEITTADRGVLLRATLIKYGEARDLDMLGVVNPVVVMERLASVLPLIKMTRGAGSEFEFRVHDLVDSYFLECVPQNAVNLDNEVVMAAVQLLTERQDYVRTVELLTRFGDSASLGSWLKTNGEVILAAGHFTSLSRAISAIPVALLMGQPRLLLLWSQLNAEMGCLEDALARSRAAKLLAEHDGDMATVRESLVASLVYLRQLNRQDEADSIAEEILQNHRTEEDRYLLAQALASLAYNKILRGEMADAKRLLDCADAKLRGYSDHRRIGYDVRQTSAIIPALAFGDFRSTAQLLSPLIHERHNMLSCRVTIRGNAATALAEMGRLDRCETLLRSAIQDIERNGLGVFAAAYLPVLGCVAAARGALPEAVFYTKRAITEAIEAKDEPGVDVARVHLATILRAAGDLDGSLVEAERAFEHLSVEDYMAFRRLAALEVAASLLALGDPAAARAWTESVSTGGFLGNQYHALRADMILAEIDRVEGGVTAGIARLAAHREYILSENPNWQIAMYGRVFPCVLGMLASAVGPSHLPAHMVRMLLPEYAERAVLESHAFLDDSTWEQMGTRLLGESEFQKLKARDGLPLCHVRVFGGLEVSIGGNVIRERDWKKRKARLLFAMLVVRRGQDIPRDQVCEHLWPEMDEEKARNNLYVIWSTMKSVLSAGMDKAKQSLYVEYVGGVCRIIRDGVRSDVDDFEDSLQRARDAEASGDKGTALRSYERIADIYRGDLLPGDCYDDWFAGLRDHYKTEFVDAMLRAAQLLMAKQDPGNALVFVRRAIQCDPYREDLYQNALRCQIAAGQRSSAIDTYLQCRDRLCDELGLDPSAETRALYSEILAMETRPQSMLSDPHID